MILNDLSVLHSEASMCSSLLCSYSSPCFTSGPQGSSNVWALKRCHWPHASLTHPVLFLCGFLWWKPFCQVIDSYGNPTDLLQKTWSNHSLCPSFNIHNVPRYHYCFTHFSLLVWLSILVFATHPVGISTNLQNFHSLSHELTNYC